MPDNKIYYYMRLKEHFFDSDEIIILENMPNGYVYSNILLKLYLKSLKRNGKLMLSDTIPYKADIIAKVTRHDVKTVKQALDIFKELGLIEIVENGAIYMTNIQSFIGKSSTEADRKRIYREQIEQDKCVYMSTDKCPDITGDIIRDKTQDKSLDISQDKIKDKCLDKSTPEIEIDTEIDTEIENNTYLSENHNIQPESQVPPDKSDDRKAKDCDVPGKQFSHIIPKKCTKIDYKLIVDLYNDICISLPKVTKLSDSRKKTISARLNTYSQEELRKVFTMAEESDFLSGRSTANSWCSFDWLMKDSNIVKVLEGNYSNKGSVKSGEYVRDNGFGHVKTAREYMDEYRAEVEARGEVYEPPVINGPFK